MIYCTNSLQIKTNKIDTENITLFRKNAVPNKIVWLRMCKAGHTLVVYQNVFMWLIHELMSLCLSTRICVLTIEKDCNNQVCAEGCTVASEACYSVSR